MCYSGYLIVIKKEIINLLFFRTTFNGYSSSLIVSIFFLHQIEPSDVPTTPKNDDFAEAIKFFLQSQIR